MGQKIQRRKLFLSFYILISLFFTDIKQTFATTYDYTGAAQTYTVPTTGIYKIELWGAQGQDGGGKGAYVYGNVTLDSGSTLYVFVGSSAGYNGGGNLNANTKSGGGGTDIRLTSSSLYSRIIVAGGGGGGGGGTAGVGGLIDGGASGNSSAGPCYLCWEVGTCYGKAGGSQTTGGGFGYGTPGISTGSGNSWGSPGGGGGWWGGYGGNADDYGCYNEVASYYTATVDCRGSGGSSFIHGASGYVRASEMTYTTSQYLFTSTGGTAGNRAGNGYAQITFINSVPNTPTLNSPTNGATNQSPKPALKTTATDLNSDYLRYKIELCTDSAMTDNCQTFDQTSSQTGWSDQNVSSTAYSSGTQATYTPQSNLSANTTYYWRSYAIDPAGTNTWSSASSIFSFTTSAAPTAPTNLLTEGQTNPSGFGDTTPEFSAIHHDPNGDSANYYEIEVNTSADFTGTVMWDSGQQSMTAVADSARSSDISYAGSNLDVGTVYYWRIRFWDTFGLVSPWANVQNFLLNSPPEIPTLISPIDKILEQPLNLTFKTTTTDDESNYLQYKIHLCTDSAMTANCQTFDQTSSQTGWSDQDVGTSAYSSGTTAVYIPSTLSYNTIYYWKSLATDPGGSGTWSATQTTPFSFRTISLSYLFNGCLIEESNYDNYLRVKWNKDNSPNLDGYIIQKSIDSDTFNTITTVGVGTTAYTDNTITQGHTYQYRIIPYFSGPIYGKLCTTSTLNLQSSNLYMEGIILGY